MERELLYELIEEYGLKAIKLGTEYEEMSFNEMDYILDYASGRLPIYVKIGGVDARNDINTLLKMGVHCFIAPMVESAYALENFITTLQELTGSTYPIIKKGINLETITACCNLESLIGSPFFQDLDQVTLARSDFSKSMGLDADDRQVYSMMETMASRVRSTGKLIIVGGSINPKNSVEIVKRIAPDRIDTRMFIIDAKDEGRIWAGVKKCLILEKKIYQRMSYIFNYREGFIESLMKKIENRLNQLPDRLALSRIT